MITIWKYPIVLEETSPEFTIEMPKSAEFVTLQVQKGVPCIWAAVDLNSAWDKTERTFRILVTGGTVDPEEAAKLEYLGTFLVEDDSFVGHLFEKVMQ
jgi:hypothetical protein